MNPTGRPLPARLAPRPPQVPVVAPPPRPDTPGTAHLKALCDDPHGAIEIGLLPRYPAGSYEMPPATAEAARQFRESLFAADPTGYFRHTGEFGQSFRLQDGQVVANDPIRYESGNSVGGGPMYAGTFTNIHSHNYAPPPFNNAFPSPNDHLAAREAAHGTGQAHELMYHPASDRFFAYSGAVPPVFFEARFPGQPPAASQSPGHSNCVASGPPPFLLPAHSPLPAPYIQPKF